MVKSLAGGCSPTSAEQTRVAVHAATTEEIVAYAKDSVAYAEFPGGMKRSPPSASRSSFYAVSLEPDKDAGMVLLLRQRGRALTSRSWRALGREEAPPPTPGMGDK
jgi:hypothetical protein